MNILGTKITLKYINCLGKTQVRQIVAK